MEIWWRRGVGERALDEHVEDASERDRPEAERNEVQEIEEGVTCVFDGGDVAGDRAAERVRIVDAECAIDAPSAPADRAQDPNEALVGDSRALRRVEEC